MILENFTTLPASPNIYEKSDMSSLLDFKYLNVYAKYLLENRFDDFVQMQLVFSKEIKPPVSKFFEHFSLEQMIAISEEPVKELLTGLCKNNAEDYIRKILEKWINDQLPFITKDQIVSDDITLLSFIHRRLFRHFITSYTTDTNVILNILNEVDLFISALDSACFKTFIEMHQQLFDVKGEVRLDKNGVPAEMLGILQDVTEQKEKALEESKKFAEKIADVSPCIITVYNINTDGYLFINKGLQTLLGYDPEEFYKNGRSLFYTLIHTDDINLVKEKIASAIAAANNQVGQTAEQITEFKHRLKHKDGSYKWMETFTIVFNRDSYNKVQDMLNISIDITESHILTRELAAVNEKIKHTELQHQRMINEVEDYAILLMDKDGFIKNWNKGAEKIKGYTASEIIGKNFRIFYRKEDQDKKLPETLIEKAARTGKASHEGWRVRKDGTTFWGSIVITALHDDNNNLIGFTKVTRNLTERKIAEDRLRDYAHRIEKHNEELQRINKDLDSFTYMASHDLQEPLRKIKTFCNIILSKSNESLQANVSDYFNRIIASVNRMQTLIDSLLNYSRTTTSEISLQPVKLNLIIEDVKKELDEMIEEKQATIICDDMPVLTIERFQFNQLFFNLIENAIKYRREDVLPEIKISAKPFYKKDDEGKENKFYRIIVRDNGIGFEQKYAENIFKLFQRLHARNEYSGTGIGLAICKKIIENHKGIITAESEPGKGSTFIIELPEKISLTEN